LERQLHPVPSTPKRAEIPLLIKDLDSESFATREAASHRLTELGAEAQPDLIEALAKLPSPETRARIEPLLRRFGKQEKQLTANELQAERAAVVLERIGTSQSRQLLELLSSGAPGARLTLAAKHALDRLRLRDAESSPLKAFTKPR
jgi:hypothetical protein